MKSPCLRTLALPILCWLAFSSARAEEITLSLGMSFDQAIEAIQKCGGQDDYATPQSSGRSWLLESYGVKVELGEHYGKLSYLTCLQPREVATRGSAFCIENGRPLQSLIFDTENHTGRAEKLPPGVDLAVGSGHWLMRTEMLFVVMSQEQALALLPDLQDEHKVDAAYTQVIAAIQRGEAKLIGYPVVYSPSGQKSTSETNFEKIYPTQFTIPKEPQTSGGLGAAHADAMPTAFEKRNTGVTLEVEAVAYDDEGKWIDLNSQSQHVEFDGMDSYEFQKSPGVADKIEQPQFDVEKDTFSMRIRSGQRVLVGMHKLLHSEQIELHILQVTTMPRP